MTRAMYAHEVNTEYMSKQELTQQVQEVETFVAYYGIIYACCYCTVDNTVVHLWIAMMLA
jgi:hypothetical protein